MNARDHKNLIRRVESHLLSLGAERTPDRSYPWTLQTPLGELGVNPNETHDKHLVTIFCCFNPAPGSPAPILAMKRFPNEVGRNGKWNFHFGSGCTVDSCFSVFAADLARNF